MKKQQMHRYFARAARGIDLAVFLLIIAGIIGAFFGLRIESIPITLDYWYAGVLVLYTGLRSLILLRRLGSIGARIAISLLIGVFTISSIVVRNWLPALEAVTIGFFIAFCGAYAHERGLDA